MAKKQKSIVKDYDVRNTSETRADLTKILQEFRKNKKKALPILFGSHGKPEAVLAPAWLWKKMIDELDDLRLALTVQSRLNNPQPFRRVTLQQLHEEIEAMNAAEAKSKDAGDPSES